MSQESIDLAEALNRACHCIAVDRERLERALEAGPASAGIYATMARDQPHLFSASPVFLARAQLGDMQDTIAAVETAVATEGFRRRAFDLAPEIARSEDPTLGVFVGYDFHLGASGAQLIEINGNAGGALLNTALARAQLACCAEVEAVLAAAHEPDALEDTFVRMFRDEWRLVRGEAPLQRVAIVDEDPEKQYLFPEFRMFQSLFERMGLEARITDPRQLSHRNGKLECRGERIDLVYNRLTDFYFEGPACAALASAYAAGDVVVTPSPRNYALYGDKRHLTVLSDPERLRAWGVASEVADRLIAAVPRTVVVDDSNREDLWRERRGYFFKPVRGYGSKAAYRGDKLTRGVWAQIARGAYVAQRLVAPSRRTIRIGDDEVPLKLDVRNYVYDGRVQLVAARLYQGQTTNFRTAGGGFAPVFTDKSPA